MTIDNNLNLTVKHIGNTYSVSHAAVNMGFFFSGHHARSQGKDAFKFWEFGEGINLVVVVDRDGDALMGALDDPSSGRTDVTMQDRLTNPLLSLPMAYRCAKMNTDTSIPYARMMQWSPDEFKRFYTEQTQKRLGVDRLIVGWHGVSDTATQTNPTADPFLRDIAKGWLQMMREQYPQNVVDEQMIVGSIPPASLEPNAYGCVDEAVLDMIHKIPPLFRDNLVCIVGDAVLFNEQQRIYSAGEYLVEKYATADTFKIFAGIPRVECVGFPSNSIVVTSLDNLSIYIKDGASFRQVQNVPQRECSRDYQTHEIAYVVENMRKFVALTNCVDGSKEFTANYHDPIAVNFDTLRSDAEKAARVAEAKDK